MRGFRVVALTVLLTSCVQPTFNYNRDWAIDVGENSNEANVDTVDKPLDLVKGLKIQLKWATHDRRQAEVVASELLFYGT